MVSGYANILNIRKNKEAHYLKTEMLDELAALASDTDCKFCRKFGVACPFDKMADKEKEDFFLGMDRDKDSLPCAQAISDRIRQVLEIKGD